MRLSKIKKLIAVVITTALAITGLQSVAFADTIKPSKYVPASFSIALVSASRQSDISTQSAPVQQMAYFDYFLGMNGSDAPVQTYTYGGTRCAWLGGSLFDCYVCCYDEDGDLITDVDDNITVEMYDTAWSPSAPSYFRGGDSEISSNGYAHVSFTAPSVYGEHSGASSMRYDSSVYLFIDSETYGPLVSQMVFVTSRIMS